MIPERRKKRTRQISSEAKDAKDQVSEKLISKKIKTENIDAEETKEVEMENPDDQSDIEYENLQLSEYERKLEKNIQDNAQFMASLGIHQAKLELELSTDVGKANQRTLNQLKSKPQKIKKDFQPTRRSARIQNIDPTKFPLQQLVVFETLDRYERKPAEDLKMGDILSDSTNMERHSIFVDSLKSLSTQSAPLEFKKPASDSLKKFLQEFNKVKITEERVRKVVKFRAFSLVIHPTVDKVLLAAGGKAGSVGLWDVSQGLSADAAAMYFPHLSPVNCLEFSPNYPEKLFTCSYDGTLRCGHFEKKMFENIYYTPEDDILLRNFVFHSPHVLLVSQSDGNVAFVDTRTDGDKAEKMFQASLKDLRTVDVHPTKRDYIITAGKDSALCLWDIRNMKVTPNKICSVPSGRMLNSAYFSPLTGKYILVSSQDDELRIYDSSQLTSKLPRLHSIRHNMQTGRWLTKFRATWHPSREDLFVCGSMERPRRIDLFSTEGHRVGALQNMELVNTVQSLNVFHPTLDVLAGVNSSGRVHVFMTE